MAENNHVGRITENNDICHGKACLRSTRIPVEMLVRLLQAGASDQEILHDFPSLHYEDLIAISEHALKRESASPKHAHT